MTPGPGPTASSAGTTPALFWWLVAASVLLALVPTVWTALDLHAATFFFGQAPTPDTAHMVDWWWVQLINQYVPALFRTVVLLALLLWLTLRWWLPLHRQWRLPLAFVVLAGALGPGLVVNLGFKDHWQRARPYQVEAFGGSQRFTRAGVMTDQCQDNCSFVSGHVACGFFLMSVMLIHRRRALVWAALGGAAGLVIGVARMADGAHWLSDVLWACPITLLTSWLVWKALLLLDARSSA